MMQINVATNVTIPNPKEVIGRKEIPARVKLSREIPIVAKLNPNKVRANTHFSYLFILFTPSKVKRGHQDINLSALNGWVDPISRI